MSDREPIPENLYTKIQFRWDGGNVRTVMLGLGHYDASITLKGKDLDMVAAAFFHLRGYVVKPGIKSFGLRKYKNGLTTMVTDDRMSLRKGVVGPLTYSLSMDDDRPDDLRLWIQSTKHTHVWFNFEMNEKTADEFGRRLADAAEWDIEP